MFGASWCALRHFERASGQESLGTVSATGSTTLPASRGAWMCVCTPQFFHCGHVSHETRVHLDEGAKKSMVLHSQTYLLLVHSRTGDAPYGRETPV